MESTRKSVFDILNHNLKLSGRRTYIHRYIYLGEHKGEKETEMAFTSIIKKLNENYCQERLTGLLVLYPNYFIHVIDGDETVLIAHVRHLLSQYNDLFGEIKWIGFYHHINQRFYDIWGVRRAKPPILLEKIDAASDLEELKRYLTLCLSKVYNLAIALRKIVPEQEESKTIGEVQPYMNQYLPEYNLIKYLLQEQGVFSVRSILREEELLFDTRFVLEQVWPVRNDFVPYNVFEVEKNPVPYLPKVPEKK